MYLKEAIEDLTLDYVKEHKIAGIGEGGIKQRVFFKSSWLWSSANIQTLMLEKACKLFII